MSGSARGRAGFPRYWRAAVGRRHGHLPASRRPGGRRGTRRRATRRAQPRILALAPGRAPGVRGHSCRPAPEPALSPATAERQTQLALDVSYASALAVAGGGVNAFTDKGHRELPLRSRRLVRGRHHCTGAPTRPRTSSTTTSCRRSWRSCSSSSVTPRGPHAGWAWACPRSPDSSTRSEMARPNGGSRERTWRWTSEARSPPHWSTWRGWRICWAQARHRQLRPELQVLERDLRRRFPLGRRRAPARAQHRAAQISAALLDVRDEGVPGDPADPATQRRVGFEVGLDFKQILDDLNIRRSTWWGYGLHVVADNIRIPFTAVGFRYDLNHGALVRAELGQLTTVRRDRQRRSDEAGWPLLTWWHTLPTRAPRVLAIGINEFFHMAVVDWGLIWRPA